MSHPPRWYPSTPLGDSSASYGWISIVLHWIAAAAVVALWLLGDLIDGAKSIADLEHQTSLHVSVALTLFLILAARLLWRVISGQPRWRSQSRLDRWASRCAHYTMLLCIGLMLVSGPVLILGSVVDLTFFGQASIPAAAFARELAGSIYYSVAHRIHTSASSVLMIVAAIHLAGACKHLMFDDDDVFLRILTPKR